MDLAPLVLRIATMAPGFLAAIVFHEAAHAWTALRFGDPTAKLRGRLSLNPAAHYDLVGTVIFPLAGALLGGVMFGWAKPVPVDTRFFGRDWRRAVFWVSFAGPLANVALAVLAAFLWALLVTQAPGGLPLHGEFAGMLRAAVAINIVIAAFNLIPFPPLDGSKMLSTFMDHETGARFEGLARYSVLFVLVLWFTPILQIVISPALRMGDGMLRLFLNLLA